MGHESIFIQSDYSKGWPYEYDGNNILIKGSLLCISDGWDLRTVESLWFSGEFSTLS